VLLAVGARLPKRSTKVPAIEERRLLLTPGEGSGGELRSEEDMFGGIGRMLVCGLVRSRVLMVLAHQCKPSSMSLFDKAITVAD